MNGFLQQIRDLGLGKYVEVMRFKDMQQTYDWADIVISPEQFCSCGLAISESLSLGIPTILSEIPSYHEIVTGYAHASFADKSSPKRFAEQVI